MIAEKRVFLTLLPRLRETGCSYRHVTFRTVRHIGAEIVPCNLDKIWPMSAQGLGGAENAGVENAGAITYGKPSE